MTDWPATKVRQAFIDFFLERNHTYTSSSSVVPYDDPTLLFTNAGMNQFKPIFLGTATSGSAQGQLRRAVNSQKCIRAGGKHNDLEDVGKDSYHHTMFEMLGNWSFGDYFKKEAIQFAWKLLTEVYKLDKSQLYVTYFEGDATNSSMEADLEARQLWLDIGVEPDHIVPGNAKDNFWEMGDVGPCGPCSEIHYDRIGGGRNASGLVNMDDPEVIEIWNIVFIQFNREKGGSLIPLPKKHIDTGMGFERLVSILQNKHSNYDTDVFSPIFEKIEDITKARPYGGKFGSEDEDGIDTAYRIVADHIRTLSFAIADGCVPNNTGRGYVLRRVLRRAARFIYRKFNVPIGTCLGQLVPTLVDQMSSVFPELKVKEQDIIQILNEEEASFAQTLGRGERAFESLKAQAIEAKNTVISGQDAWRLYESYGFPVDLTQILCDEANLELDHEGFLLAQQHSKELSKQAHLNATNDGARVKLDTFDIETLRKQGVEATQDSAKYLVGNLDNCKVLAIYKDRKFYKSSENLQNFGIILDKTNFYAEAGGQIADVGVIASSDSKSEFKVNDVQQFGEYILHIGEMRYGQISVDDQVISQYDELDWRWPVKNNHSGTHVLNYALRKVLGDDVHQKGSLVAPDKLRFDFSHRSAMKDDEISQVEDLCSSQIDQGLNVYSKDVELDTALEIHGVRAVFGETYPNPVRVVAIGVNVDDILADLKSEKWLEYSIEFCGGTHVKKTSDIKKFCIVEEFGIAKGIRRIVAYTGNEAIDAGRNYLQFAARLEQLRDSEFGPTKETEIKTAGSELERLQVSLLHKRRLNAEFEKIKKEYVDEEKRRKKADEEKAINEIIQHLQDVSMKECPVICQSVKSAGPDAKLLQQVCAKLKTKFPGVSVYLCTDSNDCSSKIAQLVFSAHQSQVPASEWMKYANSEFVDGKGGGKADLVQGQGQLKQGKDIQSLVEGMQKYFKSKLDS